MINAISLVQPRITQNRIASLQNKTDNKAQHHKAELSFTSKKNEFPGVSVLLGGLGVWFMFMLGTAGILSGISGGMNKGVAAGLELANLGATIAAINAMIIKR